MKMPEFPGAKKVKAYAIMFTQKFNIYLDKFNKLSKREKIIGVVAATFLLAVLVDQGIAQPLKRNIQGLGQKIASQEVSVLQNMMSAAQKPQVDKIYISLLEHIDNTKVNDEEIRADMLQDIERFARSNSVYLGEVKPQVSAESETFTDFFVRVQLEGNMDKLFHFIRDLVATNKLYYVETLRITPNPNNVNQIKATVSIARSVVKGMLARA